MALTVDDILTGKPRFRTKTVNYGNGLQFDLQTFDVDSFREVMNRMADKDVELSETDYTIIAMRAISGPHYEPSQAQADQFRANVDKGVLEAILRDWIVFNNGAENLADAAKKS